jgi:hypothetical protein
MLRQGKGVLATSVLRPKPMPMIVDKRIPSGRSPPMTSTSTPSTGRSKRSTTSDVAESPRGRMTCLELEALCETRGLAKSGAKPTLLKRLAEDDLKMSTDNLHAKLSALGASTDGTKETLVVRLAQADASNSAWGKKHVNAANAFWDRTNLPLSSAPNNSPLEIRKRPAPSVRDFGTNFKRVRPDQIGTSGPTSIVAASNQSSVPVDNVIRSKSPSHAALAVTAAFGTSTNEEQRANALQLSSFDANHLSVHAFAQNPDHFLDGILQHAALDTVNLTTADVNTDMDV